MTLQLGLFLFLYLRIQEYLKACWSLPKFEGMQREFHEIKHLAWLKRDLRSFFLDLSEVQSRMEPFKYAAQDLLGKV